MTVISHAKLGLVRTPIFYIILLLLLPAALEVRIYEVAFFASVWLHDNFILSENKLFRVKDAKTRPRLNTEWSLPNHDWKTDQMSDCLHREHGIHSDV